MYHFFTDGAVNREDGPHGQKQRQQYAIKKRDVIRCDKRTLAIELPAYRQSRGCETGHETVCGRTQKAFQLPLPASVKGINGGRLHEK
jgi:hypothetical protein